MEVLPPTEILVADAPDRHVVGIWVRPALAQGHFGNGVVAVAVQQPFERLVDRAGRCVQVEVGGRSELAGVVEELLGSEAI